MSRGESPSPDIETRQTPAGNGITPQTFSPLDDYYRTFIRKDLVQIYRVRGRRAFLKTIEIDVIKQKPALVKIDQGKRRAGYVFFVQAQRACDSLHEDGLARAQWAVKQNNLAT